MRDLRFRAWDKKRNEWYNENNPHSLIFTDFHVFGECTLLCTPSCDDLQYLEITQFTGLQDKNGKDIYDGDIINYGIFALNDNLKYGDRAWENLPSEVCKDDISTILETQVVDFSIPTLYALKQAIEHNPDVNGVEVIGNIYENPDLITK